MRSSSLRRVCGVLTAFILSVGVMGAFAQHAAKGNPKNDDANVAAQSAADTKNQRVRPPSQEEIQTLLEGMKKYVNQSTEGLEVKTAPNGAQFIDIDGRFENLTLAKIGTDGKVTAECVNNVKDAEKFLKSSETRKPAPKAPVSSDPATWEVK